MDNKENVEVQNPLGTTKIGTLIVQYAVPSIISLVVSSLYNMVDQVFIGQGVGYLGNAATNVIMPLMVTMISLGLLVGNGAASYMSLQLGKGENESAARGVGNMVVLSVGVGIVAAIVCEIFLRPICILFGGTDEVLEYAIDYGRIIVIGFPVSIIGGSFGNVIRADGRPKQSMIGMLIGCFTNIILDPIFIFVFHWGVKGAAFATIIGQALNAIYYIFCMFHFKTIRLTRNDFKLRKNTVTRVLALGAASFITQFAAVPVMAVENNLLVKYGDLSIYGGDITLAAFGITSKVSQLIMSVALGIATGVQPIIGYNYGSKQYDRVKKTLKIGLISCVIVMIVAWIIFEFFPEPLILLFGENNDLYMEFAKKCFRIFLLCCILIPFSLVIPNFFQSIGRPVLSTVLALIRQIVILIPAMLILTPILGVEGVLWAGPISDTLAAIICVIVLKVYWNRIFEIKKGDKNG